MEHQYKPQKFSNHKDSDAGSADLSIVRFIDNIILEANNKKASDIHFEPYENYYRVRMRIDGILYEITQTEVTLTPRIAARLKIMANLDIAEKRLPQDGRFNFKLTPERNINFRINCCPTLFGEKIVLRLLATSNLPVGIDVLGLNSVQRAAFLEAIYKPQGLILVTGPTGRGKTITLYTALNLLNKIEKNISTAEDPVEIYLAGINQVNVNTKTGLSFANTLRAFLRQDPDIIMLGEIRDQETAEISIKASQTGHLVLSTLHTNDTIGTLTRLRNIGIATFNIASSISLIIAQRLIRCLCPHCKQKQEMNQHNLLKQGFSKNTLEKLQLYQAVGCEHCTAGYLGRTAIFELLPINIAIREAILKNQDSFYIRQEAIHTGMLNLRHAALGKVRQGITSLEEINRVLN